MSRKAQIAIEKGKTIAFNTTKRVGSNKDVHKIIAIDESPSLNEEEMAFLTKRFARFFQCKKNPIGGVKRDSSSKKDLRSRKKEDNSKDVSKIQSGRNYFN